MAVSSPKTISNFTNTSANRGIETKEIEIANTRLDVEASSSGAAAAGDAACSPPTDHSSASYVQVVVQKQRRGSRRLPHASSPTPPELNLQAQMARCDEAVPTAVLLACPAFAALHQQPWNHLPALFPEKNKNVTLNRECAGAKGTNGAAEALQKQNDHRLHQKKTSKNIFWRRIRNIASGREEYWSEEGPDRIEVYPFERGCEALWSRSAARVTRVERLARALAGPAGDLFAELLAASHLLFTLPVDVVLKIARCSLAAGRAAACGAVAALADEALKPALALGYNALARPPLVLAAQLAAAAREALRPLWLALADAAEPLARVLAAVRLVHVETRCACAHRV